MTAKPDGPPGPEMEKSMTKLSLNKDASAEDNADVSTPVIDTSHSDAIEAIAGGRKKQVEDDNREAAVMAGVEYVEVEEPEPSPEEIIQAAGAAPTGNDAAAAAEEKPIKTGDEVPSDAPVYLKDGQWVTMIKVDGQEQEVAYDKVVRTAQKHESADVRLQQASRQHKDLDVREQDISKRESELKDQTQPSGEDAGNTASSFDVQEKSKKVVDSIYKGDTEEAVAGLSEIIGNATPVDADAIAKKVRQDIKAEDVETARVVQENATADAWTEFSSEENFADIATDKKKFAVADAFCDEIQQEHQDWSASQVLMEAGKKTREYLGNKEKKPVDTRTRMDRKEDLDDVTPAGGAAQIGETEEKPKTGKDILAEMREGRGQQ